MLSKLLKPIYFGITEQFTEAKYNWCRNTLRTHGVLLETALEMAKYTGARATSFTPSLGEYGHRDWTQLRVNTHWLAPKPTEDWGAAFSRLVEVQSTPAAEFDIAAVTNILLAKSDLSNYASMEAFERRCPNDQYGQGTRSDLDRCLAHDQIRCLKGTLRLGDTFATFAWDGRLLLKNAGGAHHFSAARQIARELGEKVPLQLNLSHHTLNAEAVRHIERSLALVIIPEDPREIFCNSLRRALAEDGVPVVAGSFMPPHYCGREASLLALSLNDERSVEAARYLRECGFTDLVAHLVDDIEKQQAIG